MCVGPVVIGDRYNQAAGNVALVRCGKCDECRTMRRLAWVGRLMLELENYPANVAAGEVYANGMFLTLTYDDAHLPRNGRGEGRLRRFHIQQFMRKMRYRFGKLRYFCCGEYGDLKGRPHYHMILYGIRPEPWVMLQGGSVIDLPEWEYGSVWGNCVNAKTIGYTCGYTVKAEKLGRTLSAMSLKPGIGGLQLERLGRVYADRHRDRAPDMWPHAYMIMQPGVGTLKPFVYAAVGGDGPGLRYNQFGGMSGSPLPRNVYPLIDGGLKIFKRAYYEAGGLLVPERPVDERTWEGRAFLSDPELMEASERRRQEDLDKRSGKALLSPSEVMQRKYFGPANAGAVRDYKQRTEKMLKRRVSLYAADHASKETERRAITMRRTGGVMFDGKTYAEAKARTVDAK